jgi:hypothetical protein
MVDGSVEARPAADLSQDGSRHTNESSAFVGSCEDGSGALGESSAFGRVSQRVERFGIED